MTTPRTAIATANPGKYDAVLGGQQLQPYKGAMVLGGLDGVRSRLSSSLFVVRLKAIEEAVKYAPKGFDLVIGMLEDKNPWIKRKAYQCIYSAPQIYNSDVVQEWRARQTRYKVPGRDEPLLLFDFSDGILLAMLTRYPVPDWTTKSLDAKNRILTIPDISYSELYKEAVYRGLKSFNHIPEEYKTEEDCLALQ